MHKYKYVSSISCVSISCTNISCTTLYNNINTCLNSLSYGTVSLSFVNFCNASIISQCSLFNTSIISFVNLSIVNTQSNLTAITNLSSSNCSFAFCNVSTLTCKNGNIINLSSTNTSFQNISVSYLILDTSTQNTGLLCQFKKKY